MKKFLIVLLTMLVCLSACMIFAACDNKDKSSSESNKNDTETQAEVHTHAPVKVDAEEATCYDSGNSEYYYCSCGKYFSDANGTTEIAASSWVVDATGHTLTKVDATDPSCSKEGNVEYYSCADCGDNFMDEQGEWKFGHNGWVIDALSHSLTKIEATAATCTKAGNTEHYACDCGAYFADAYATEAIEENSWVIPATSHTLDPETGRCADCDAEME